jgi:hypothetical protein
MAQATAKFTYLKVRQIWGAKSPDKEKLITMIADQKGKLKLGPNLEKKKKKKKKDNKAKDKDEDGSTGGGDNKKKKNKKDTSNKKNQKKEEAWKRVPPKKGEAKEKIVKEKTYHWWEHHMAWGSTLPRMPWTLKEGCPEGPSADDGRCCRCNHCKPLLCCLPL